MYLLVVLYGAATIQLVSGTCSSTVVSTCSTFEDGANDVYGMVIRNICFVYMGDATLAQSISGAYTTCSSRKNPFDYGRLAIFETPSMYSQFIDMLNSNYASYAYTMLAATTDGVVSSTSSLADYKWTGDGSSIMCPIFNKSSPAGASLDVVGAGTYKYALCPMPDDGTFSFSSFADDGSMDMHFICEFGCGSAPIYASTPEWWDIPGSLAGFTAPTTPPAPSATTSTPAPTRSTSTKTSTSTSSTKTSSSSTASSASTSTSTATRDACDAASLEDKCAKIAPGTSVGRVIGTTEYNCYNYQSGSSSITTLTQMDASCMSVCNSTADNYPLAYGRVASFQDPSAFHGIMGVFDASHLTGPVVIGAVGPGSATSLQDYRWSCSGEPTCQSSIIASNDNVPATYMGSSPAATTVLASCPNKPDAFYSYDADHVENMPYLCLCNCMDNKEIADTSAGWNSAPTVQPLSTSGCYATTSISTSTLATTSTSMTTPSSTSSTSTSAQTSSSSTSSSSTSIGISTSMSPPASCVKSYSQTPSCISDTPLESHPNIAQPQGCANLCSSTTGCRSFNFQLGDASCSQNECLLFSVITSEATIDPLTTTSGSVGGCVHYDSVE